MGIDTIIKIIKEKKELKGISDFVIKGDLLKYIKKHSLNIENISKRDLKIIIKDIRSELRFFVGQYQFKVKERRKILNKEIPSNLVTLQSGISNRHSQTKGIDNSDNYVTNSSEFSKGQFPKQRDTIKEIVHSTINGNVYKDKFDELLKTHSSTSERLSFYPVLIKILSDLKIKSILDLGCGLNPLALSLKGIEYFASDINEYELSIIQEYFKKNKINGKTFIYDIRKTSYDLPRTDLTILLKVLDLVSKNDRKLSEKIILNIKSKYSLISFSTKKISGQKMNFPERKWFEKILRRNKLIFKKFYSENEVFYLIFLREI